MLQNIWDSYYETIPLHYIVRDVIPTPDLRIGTGSARSETRPDRGRLPLMAVGPLSRSAI
jgi:hypothetical protein